MKNKSSYSADEKLNEVDVIFFLRKLWNRKILILSISIIFALLSYFYSLSEGKKYKITVWLKILSDKDIFLEFFEVDDPSLGLESIQTIFNSLLISSTNFQNFIEKNEEFDEFKNFLKKKNISGSDYYIRHSGTTPFDIKNQQKNISNSYYFVDVSNVINSEKLFLAYIKFSYEIAVNTKKKKIGIFLLNKLRDLEKNLEIALSNNIVKPQFDIFMFPKSPQMQVYNLFQRGSNLLNQDISRLKEEIKKLDNFRPNNDIVLDIQKKSENRRPEIYSGLGFALGFFISFLIILFEPVFLKKKKHF